MYQVIQSGSPVVQPAQPIADFLFSSVELKKMARCLFRLPEFIDKNTEIQCVQFKPEMQLERQSQIAGKIFHTPQ